MRNDLIIDFETMSVDATKCAVIDCSAYVFNWDKFLSDDPYTCKTLADVTRFKLSVKQQVVDYGWEVEESVVQFWQGQSPEVRAKIAPKKDDLPVGDFITEFTKFLSASPKIDYWWSRSNNFDPTILRRLFISQNKLPVLDEYLMFWRMRDIRTYIDAKFDFTTKNGFVPIADEDFWNKVFKEHDSSWDIVGDLLRIQAIARAENDLEQVDR